MDSIRKDLELPDIVMQSIDHDNLEEYCDPEDYDAEQLGDVNGRVAFYGQLAEASGDTALEIGCGTGLVTIPTAKRGVSMTGVDICPSMLAHARFKADHANVVIRWIECDARLLKLETKFDFIYMAANTFQAFLDRDSQYKLLTVVRNHLCNGGVFAFDTRNPIDHCLTSVSDDQFWGTYLNSKGAVITVSGTQFYDSSAHIMHWTTFRRWNDTQGSQQTVRRIACKFTDVNELNELVGRCGFQIRSQFGSWAGGPLGPSSERIISVLTC